MESSIVSLILAEALVHLPKITAAELYERCTGQIGTTTLPQFRIELTKWLNDGTIPGYEARLGRAGGIYKKGSPTVSLNSGEKKPVQLDPAPIGTFIQSLLLTQVRVTVSDLMGMIDYSPLTGGQFRAQMSEWLNDGKTFPLFEARKGPTGGIYMKGTDTEAWLPSNSDTDSEYSNGFAVQITSHLKIQRSDERNWVIVKLNGNTWVNKAYHPDLGGCLKSLVKHAVNGEFGCANSLVQLKDLAKVIGEMEGRIFVHLEKNIQAQA